MQIIDDQIIDSEFGLPESLRGEILFNIDRFTDGPLAGHRAGWQTLTVENFRMLKAKTPAERNEMGWGEWEQDFINNDF